jgi:hypothetical protein
MGKKDPRVDAYIEKAQPFARPILKFIRKAVHAGCPEVTETLKWNVPSFEYKGLLCGMAAFKEHVRFGFWKSELIDMPGPRNGGGLAQAGLVKSVDDLPPEKELIGLVKRAAALNDQGINPSPPKRAPKPPLATPPAFSAALRKNKKAQANFGAFSPSHKREYLEWIVEAKQDATRDRRIETAVEWIAAGKPRNWKYM